ncbi:hypothetical protein [Actinoplanes sp. NPDC049316]|uniref:hypothetical protein n=1 Tax=Actinoplanes sp. NPDC049316 TaxID=3154727 RepID=UPI003418A1F5
MELSLTTILTVLWSTFGALTVLVAVLFWRSHRTARPPAPVQPAENPDTEALEEAHRLWLDGLSGSTGSADWDDLSDTGRHHLPAELLNLSTYQLGPDRLARAKVPEQN